jgi:membrane protein DedA with SNARE-associated domain
LLGQSWEDIARLLRENQTLVEVALFVLAFAESIVVVSIFVPSTLIFIAIGALEGAAGGVLAPLVIAGALGALAGDVVSFALGNYFRNDIERMPVLRHRLHVVERARKLVGQWGIAAIIVSKTTGPFRPLVPMLAGASSMPWIVFIVASAISSALWSVLVLVPAYYGLNLIAQ